MPLSSTWQCQGRLEAFYSGEGQTYLVKAQPFTLMIPREGFEKGKIGFARVSEWRQIFSQDNDNVWADALRLRNQLELVQSLRRISTR